MAQEISFEFLGQCFTFRSELSEEEIKEVLAYLEGKKRELEAYKRVPTYKLAIWLLLQVAYDYVKTKKEKESLESLLKGQIAKVEKFFDENLFSWGARE